MKVALCTCEGRVKRGDLEKIKGVEIFDSLCKNETDRRFDIIGCSYPSLKNVGRILIDLNNLVFLKQKESIEKAKLILKAYSELMGVHASFIDAEVDDSLLVKTDDFELAFGLSKHFDPLYVLTDNPAISEVAVAIKGEIKSIKGKIGKFEVKIDGVEIRSGKKVGSITVSQIFIPGLERTKEGMYSSYHQIFDAIYNKGGIVKINPLSYKKDRCGVSFNGVSGCDLCKCNHGFIIHGQEVQIDLMSCYGCGLCSSLCPSDALSFQIFPREALLKMIDVMSEYRKKKTLLFACRNAIGKVYEGGKTDSFFPIILPCINALSEVEVFYPLLNGFSGVYILPCDCPHGSFEGLKKAGEIASVFGIDRIVIQKEFNPEVIKKLNSKKPISNKFKLNSDEKRRQLIEIVSYFKNHFKPTIEKMDLDEFGYLKVSESCTLCKTCSSVCPMNAIERNGGKLEFTHGLCINCDLCRIFCPENSIKIEEELLIPEIDVKKVLKEEKMIRCPRCNKEHISESEYKKVSALTGHKIFTLYCNECKPIIVFEGIYKELAGEGDGEGKGDS